MKAISPARGFVVEAVGTEGQTASTHYICNHVIQFYHSHRYIGHI